MSLLRYVTLFSIVIFIVSCNEKYSNHTFYEMGTVVEITLQDNDEVKKVLGIIKSTTNMITETTKQINNAKINEKITLNNDFKHLINKSNYFNKISNGRFDITLATITSLYGFPDGPFKIPADSVLKRAYEIFGQKNIIIKNNQIIKKTNLEIDTGAYSKGYIVDKAISYLKSQKISGGLINAGGDLYALGNKNGRKWKIAIQHPSSKEKYLSIVNLENSALATSGNYERFFEKNVKRIIHIFDGKTGKTANNYQSVSVIADTTEMADGLATVYFLSTVDEIKKQCKKLKTPVLIYTLDNKLLKLCDWERFE